MATPDSCDAPSNSIVAVRSPAMPPVAAKLSNPDVRASWRPNVSVFGLARLSPEGLAELVRARSRLGTARAPTHGAAMLNRPSPARAAALLILSAVALSACGPGAPIADVGLAFTDPA